jgi:hypothetical protein
MTAFMGEASLLDFFGAQKSRRPEDAAAGFDRPIEGEDQ